MTAKWVPDGLNTLDARLSLSDISYQVATGNDFRGFNGAVGWNWQPTGKIQTRLTLFGAPGYTATFYGFDGGALRVTNSKFARTVRMSGTYLATGRLPSTEASA